MEGLQEQLKNLSDKLEGKSKDIVDNAIEKFNDGFDAKVEKKAQELVDGAVKALEEGAMKELQDHLDKLDIKIQSKKGGQKEIKLSEEIKEKKESLLKASSIVGKEVELKALTNTDSVANSPSGYVIPEITQLGVKERSLYNVLPKRTVSDGTNQGTVRYRDWNESTTVRAAAMVAEGAAFPESTAKFTWYNKDLRKVGDTLPVTAEFFEDEQQAAGELEMFLRVNVETKIDDQLINGDNTGQNLEGLMTSAQAYTAVASGISAPNLKDLVIKMRNDITRTRGSIYRPDICVVSSSTMENLVLAKDENNNYIFDENTGTLGGLFVVVDENTQDNEIVIGDRRFATIYEKTGVVISKGEPGVQFLEDEMTIKARKRMLLLVKNQDKKGFRKVTDVSAALNTLGTAVA